MQFAGIEPQAMSVGTLVEESMPAGVIVMHFSHCFAANGAAASLFTGFGDYQFNGCTAVKQQLQLPGIEPDASAAVAMVNLNTIQFLDDHFVFTVRTLHGVNVKMWKCGNVEM